MENKLVSSIEDFILLLVLILISSVNIYFIIKVFVIYIQNNS